MPSTDVRIERVGSGSYYLDRPPGVDGPSTPPRRAHFLDGPMPTNRFWSSAACKSFSDPIYAHPLAVKAGPDGLGISYPDIEAFSGDEAERRSAAFHAYYREELVLGVAGCTFAEAVVSGYSDWTVDLSFLAETHVESLLDVRVGHGFPYVYANVLGGRPSCTFREKPEEWHFEEPHAIGLKVGDNAYGLFGPPGSVWTWDGAHRLLCDMPAGDRSLAIAILPNTDRETFLLFAKHARAVPEDTDASFTYDAQTGRVKTQFVVATQQGDSTAPVIALYPHQWAALDLDESDITVTPHTYRSPRGLMRLVAGRRFVTSHRFSGILPYLPLGETADQALLKQLLADALRAPMWPLGMGSKRYDTYLVGKSLNRIAQLVPIADQLGDIDARDRLLGALKGRLERWFTVPSQRPEQNGAADEFFWYDDAWGALLGHPSSHGAATDLNDHHFHYGYFIHAAGIVALYDRAWANDEAWGGMVKLLARDFACLDKKDRQFPRLRCFDPFAGHSWASGTAAFREGNNQESSSEAMHAWAGLILFGEATGDRALRDLGVWGYVVESHAVWHYWFDVTGSHFPGAYGHKVIARLFGSGGDHDTWWTRHPIEVHGINALPLTGASLYLGAHPERAKLTLDELWDETGGAITHWADIIYGFLALVDPVRAWQAWPLEGAPEFGETKARTYHWLAALRSLGRVDPQTSADIPLAAVFQKENLTTYVMYHTDMSRRSVAFSDGAVWEAEPFLLTVRERRLP